MIKKLFNRISKFSELNQKILNLQNAIGRIEQRQLEAMGKVDHKDWEFKVHSQWGEDGIIQFLLQNVEIENKIFVEFGVENYTEANTLFLLQNNYWSGFVIDGSLENINEIKSQNIYWRHNLTAISSFITKENINDIFKENNIKGDIGILSVDIDGNDYWVWEKIQNVYPAIVIAEYNSLFGSNLKVTVPYKNDFVRGGKNPVSYYGASISALTYLANKKGYQLVASNKAGNNIFYVRNDLMGKLKVLTPSEAYVGSQFRESKDSLGNLTFKNFDEAQQELYLLPVVEVETSKESLFKELLQN
jgi:hypothetical protein